MVIGGLGRRDVVVLEPNNQPGVVKASAPFVTTGAIGLLDRLGRPMICGGGRNPQPQRCHVYMDESDEWVRGRNTRHARKHASVTCLKDGTCWVFGGVGYALTYRSFFI